MGQSFPTKKQRAEKKSNILLAISLLIPVFVPALSVFCESIYAKMQYAPKSSELGSAAEVLIFTLPIKYFFTIIFSIIFLIIRDAHVKENNLVTISYTKIALIIVAGLIVGFGLALLTLRLILF